MEDKSKLMFIVLSISGIACILASLGAMAYLYHEHAMMFNMPRERNGLSPFEMFMVSVGLPSLASFVIGIALVAIGIKIGLKDRAR